MNRYSDKLQMLLDKVYSGKNYVNLNLSFFGISSLTTENTYTNLSGTTVYGEWWKDGGSLSVPVSDREDRIVCNKGKMTFTVSGKTVILRLYVNTGYGTATVRIDGHQPSTISGVLDAKDTVSAECSVYNSWGEEAIDIVLADNLSMGDHIVELYCDNGTTEYFPVIGVKSVKSTFNSNVDTWIMNFTYPHNRNVLTIKNNSDCVVKNTVVTFPTNFVDDSGNPIGSKTYTSLNPLETQTIPFTMLYPETTEVSGTDTKAITLQADYEDPVGSITYNIQHIIGSHDTSKITYTADHWILDNSNGKDRAFNDLANVTATVQFSGDQLVVEIQKDYGWGKLNTTIDGTPSTQLDCHDAVGGGFYVDTAISVTGTGNHTLVMTSNSADPAPFANVKYTIPTKYTSTSTSYVFTINKKQIPPFPPVNIVKNIGGPTCDSANTSLVDLSIPCKNAGTDRTNIYWRVPTFMVYYGTGKEEIISQYDIVILDLFAVSRAQVKRLQDKGIKVLIYVSFGEENGTIADIYDPTSAKVPWTGDGTGPGGYAGYYCKGGNSFCEACECKHDNQSKLGTKTCAKSNAKYYSGTGRCSKACQKDWRDGYLTQSVGGNCSAGHNSSNYWNRTAQEACSNSTCPDYLPINQKCTEFELNTNPWGQDFSIMTTNFPDCNGVWGSYYADMTKAAWRSRLVDFYINAALGTSTTYTDETHTVVERTFGGEKYYCFQTTHYPIDFEATIAVKSNGGIAYTNVQEYSYDPKLGAFKIKPLPTSPQLVNGDTIKVTYTTLGLDATGLFMDTVDTVDVYPSSAYKTAFSTFINAVHTSYPTKEFCSNRGFTILGDIITSCDYVMFESFLSDYNWDTKKYEPILDLSYAKTVIDQLNTLRSSNTFDVLALNYCSNESEDDSLRNYITLKCRELGFLSWTTTILLDDPAPNNEIKTTESNSYFVTNAWRLGYAILP